MRELTYLIAASRDGYIAAADGSTEAFDPTPEVLQGLIAAFPETMPTPFRDVLGLEGPNQHFDAVIMGRDTYEVGAVQGLTSPYEHLDQYVVSTTLTQSPDPAVTLVGTPVATVRGLKEADGLGIWLCGGGALASSVADEIDEVIVKRQPFDLAAGRRLFSGDQLAESFKMVAEEALGDVVIERYRRS